MSCFWRGILKSLTLEELKYLGLTSTSLPEQVVRALQQKNRRVDGYVKWQGKHIQKKLADEIYKDVRVFNHRDVANGKLVSTCEPFLVLYAAVLQSDVVHNYAGNMIRMSVHRPRKTVHFNSSRTHFEFHKNITNKRR